LFVIQGPPDAVIPIECEDVYVPLQIWYYERIEVLKSKLYVVFYQPGGVGPYKMWLPLDGRGVILVGVGSISQLQAARVPDIQRCFEWRTVNRRFTCGGPGHRRFLRREPAALAPWRPRVDQILSMTTTFTPTRPRCPSRARPFPEPGPTSGMTFAVGPEERALGARSGRLQRDIIGERATTASSTTSNTASTSRPGRSSARRSR
jgi:hypothetical protein